jgi:hypothetical protein
LTLSPADRFVLLEEEEEPGAPLANSGSSYMNKDSEDSDARSSAVAVRGAGGGGGGGGGEREKRARVELEGKTVKELREVCMSKGIDTSKCSDKRDLVDLGAQFPCCASTRVQILTQTHAALLYEYKRANADADACWR